MLDTASGYHQAPNYSGSQSPDVKIKVTVLEYKGGRSASRSPGAKSINVYLSSSSSVLDLKRAVHSSVGVPERVQTPIYKGQVLHNNFVLSNVPGLCGEDGSNPHVRIVVRDFDAESGRRDDFLKDAEQESTPLKGNEPPPDYFQRPTVFRRMSTHGSFSGGQMSQTPLFQFPREIDEETQLVRKVYAALSLQMLATTIISALFMFYEPLTRVVLGNHTLFFYGSFAVSIVFLLALTCYKQKYPTNVYLLIGFTAAMATQVGIVCAMVAAGGLAHIVLQAFVYTAAIFGALTIYAWTTRVDLRSWGPYLFVGLIVMVIWGFVSMLFGFQGGWLYSMLGAVLFSAYILYDTSRLLHTFGTDESWVLFTIDLYLDIINLFLFILDILLRSQQNN